MSDLNSTDSQTRLTPKQARFVDEYLVDLNGTAAYKRAGFNPSNDNVAAVEASKLLRNPKVAEAIAQARQEVSERTQFTQDWVLNNIAAIARRCMQSVPVLDKKGNVVLCETDDGEMLPAYTFNASGATRALELIGKHLGMFGDTVDVTVAVSQLKEQVKSIDDNALMDLIARGAGGTAVGSGETRPN